MGNQCETINMLIYYLLTMYPSKYSFQLLILLHFILGSLKQSNRYLKVKSIIFPNNFLARICTSSASSMFT